jgi:drug/metabolite transporter (DMT)-like permease
MKPERESVESAPLEGFHKAPARLGAIAGSYGLLVIVTLLKPFSNLFLAWGMRQFSEVLALNPAVYLRAMLEPFVALGIVMQILWLLTRMSLLSVADLSFVLPVTSAGYVLSTLLGRVFLHEPVSASRWAGAILISLGAALVVSTPEKTTEGAGIHK